MIVGFFFSLSFSPEDDRSIFTEINLKIKQLHELMFAGVTVWIQSKQNEWETKIIITRYYLYSFSL